MVTLSAMMTALTALGWTMLCTNNPMNLSMIIMSMSILLAIMFSMNLSSWYALILFLIYIGGMMVMFSYFVSLSSNDPMMTMGSIYSTIIPILLMKTMKLQIITPMFYSSQIYTMYSPKNMITLLLISITLLMMMVIVVKMVKKNNGPLRGFNQLTSTY